MPSCEFATVMTGKPTPNFHTLANRLVHVNGLVVARLRAQWLPYAAAAAVAGTKIAVHFCVAFPQTNRTNSNSRKRLRVVFCGQLLPHIYQIMTTICSAPEAVMYSKNTTSTGTDEWLARSFLWGHLLPSRHRQVAEINICNVSPSPSLYIYIYICIQVYLGTWGARALVFQPGRYPGIGGAQIRSVLGF